jgi:hypothetical protein
MGQSEAIVAEIKRSAEELLRWVKEHPNCTLRDLEERIQEWKNQAGVQLLEASVAMQGTGRWAEGACVCGGQWVFQGYRERQGMTSQGVIRLKRAYFTCPRCGRGFFPLDQEKGIEGGWSERGLEQVLWIAQAVSSYREAEEALQRLAGQSVPRSTIHRLVERYGGRLAEGRRKEAEGLWERGVRGDEIPAPREGPKKEMGISLDGVMVWVDGGWHEVKVGSCFEFGPGKDGEVEVRPIGYWAGYGEVEVFRRTMWGYAYHRGLGLEGKAVVIGDGASWIDGFAEVYCPKGVRVVDWYHAVEHLWALGREAFGEEAAKWVENVKQKLWEGRIEQVIRDCEEVLGRKSGWREGVVRTAEYFRERREQMDYPAFRKAGYPIGSGTVESACKGISWRCKGRGQRWKAQGLVAILALRSAGMGGEAEWNRAWKEIGLAA